MPNKRATVESVALLYVDGEQETSSAYSNLEMRGQFGHIVPMEAPDLEATVTFMTKKEGGRISPVWTGYRPRFCYDEEEVFAEHEYPDVDKVFPGESARVLIYLADSSHHLSKLYKGMSFEVKDGEKLVATGTLIRLLS